MMAMLAATLATTGCSVQQKGSNGNDDVKIQTPVGGFNFKTNDAAIPAEIGLPAYPGAAVLKDDKSKGAADIDMSFGDFHLRVRAVGYHTPDSPEKVRDFYRKELLRYGNVIECRDDRPVGTPSKTGEGLTCDEGKHITISTVDRHARDEFELKTGSKLHQHIVAITPQSDGTKFGLVSLDLPLGEKQSN
jgi:hypothetical protein